MCLQKLFCLLTVTFSLVTVVNGNQEVEALYDESVKADVRILPDELLQMLNQKSEYERAMEECMKEFIECSSHRLRDVVVCAINVEGSFKFFESMCEMLYENCKLNRYEWTYLDDKICHLR